MTVHVLVDMLFYTGTRGGTETYAREIIKRMPEAFADVRLTALANRAGAERIRGFFPGDVQVVDWVGADRVSWAAGEVLAVNARAKRARVDVIWSPANFAPITRSRAARVTTTHDVTYHTAGGGIGGAVTRITSWLMTRAALTSDAVITGSHAAEEAVTLHMGIAADEITVIPHGTNAPNASEDPWRELAEIGIHPGRPVLLSTGNRLPHKNFEGLLRAVAQLDGPRPLVVIPGSHGKDPLAPLVEKLGLQHDVVLPGWVSSAQLEALFAVAAVYVCPSLTEGFGLPVIDAMRRGCLVLANDVLVLREVGGDVAMYADATSPELFGAAIVRAIHEDGSERRHDGVRRASEYTWERSAAETARLIESTAARNRGPA
ncbi:glycosyltransferase family 4 protein [Microbacterium timonense]|uniref:glycosyltransferase family 4 protein n=1 Tax=Microbacterium timonense TaxID=2086576 RepID=UPI000D10649B|nr:glycosyltransferase family 1 protein [Microbacterium timonense]